MKTARPLAVHWVLGMRAMVWLPGACIPFDEFVVENRCNHGPALLEDPAFLSACRAAVTRELTEHTMYDAFAAMRGEMTALPSKWRIWPLELSSCPYKTRHDSPLSQN